MRSAPAVCCMNLSIAICHALPRQCPRLHSAGTVPACSSTSSCIASPPVELWTSSCPTWPPSTFGSRLSPGTPEGTCATSYVRIGKRTWDTSYLHTYVIGAPLMILIGTPSGVGQRRVGPQKASRVFHPSPTLLLLGEKELGQGELGRKDVQPYL